MMRRAVYVSAIAVGTIIGAFVSLWVAGVLS